MVTGKLLAKILASANRIHVALAASEKTRKQESEKKRIVVAQEIELNNIQKKNDVDEQLPIRD